MSIFSKGRVAFGVVAVGAVVALAGCSQADPTAPDTGDAGGGDSSQIVVGSFAFPESEILGEIYAQALKAKGFDVQTKFNIGPRQQTIPALQDGSINLIPEYNGNLLAYYDTAFTQRTTDDVDAALTDAVAKDNLTVYSSAAAEDKDAYVVTQAYAQANGLTSIGDLSKVQPFSLGANPQFAELGYGIPGLKSVYGVSDVTFVPYEDFGGPDTVKALTDNTVQVADIYTTSPALKAENLLVLKDPENLIAAQNVLPLLSKSIDTPELKDALDAISAKLTTDDLIDLRDRVEGSEQASASTAAADWLKNAGLL
ncbi:ABC transporter substrate-binding protein [Microbacterium sp. SL62]|uniref:ABC transporter substrate-binding protein n=1 Tax=Microbacterium sp. SL62 TaxID=2995139 RepID=UPI0022739678|nr:ABC transporter substrate-binding protein [Microbacterium sp. SL62]MCY1717795.1 ABC transporter substrate-binding protein [Microbacterium sp. SL62]